MHEKADQAAPEPRCPEADARSKDLDKSSVGGHGSAVSTATSAVVLLVLGISAMFAWASPITVFPPLFQAAAVAGVFEMSRVYSP